VVRELIERVGGNERRLGPVAWAPSPPRFSELLPQEFTLVQVDYMRRIPLRRGVEVDEIGLHKLRVAPDGRPGGDETAAEDTADRGNLD
jgi:hypothetical protein